MGTIPFPCPTSPSLAVQQSPAPSPAAIPRPCPTTAHVHPRTAPDTVVAKLGPRQHPRVAPHPYKASTHLNLSPSAMATEDRPLVRGWQEAKVSSVHPHLLPWARAEGC